MSLFYKKPNEEKPKPTDLETILDLQDQNTRMKLLVTEIHGRLWSGFVFNGCMLMAKGMGVDEMDMHSKLMKLQWIAQEYVKLTEKHNEPIPERLAEYCEKYREKKPDSPL